jgi:hypothetical protein
MLPPPLVSSAAAPFRVFRPVRVFGNAFAVIPIG